MKRLCCLLIGLLWYAGHALPQGEPGRFAISQITYQPPQLMAYVDVLDQSGRAQARLAPADFSAKMDQQDLKVTSVTSFDKSGEGVAYVFLVDISKSIQRDQFNEMRMEIDGWIDGLAAVDRMAIFTFGDQEKELVDFTSDKTSLKAALQKVVPTDNQTKLYLALRNSLDLWQRTDAGLPSRRVIVILSDGKDEGSGFTADDVGRMVQQSPMPIYAIGFSRLPLPERITYLEALNRIASLSGGIYLSGSSLPEAYTEIREAIRRVFIVQLACPGCQVSTQSQPLEMTLRIGNTSRADRLAVNLSLQTPAKEQSLWNWIKEHVTLKIAIAAAFGISIVIVVPIAVKSGKKKPDDPDSRAPLPEPLAPVVAVVIPAGRKIQLTVVAGNERGRVDTVNLAARAIVGRDKSCDVSYPDDTEMSAKHFELIQAGEYVEVQDLGSTNGTLLNGSRLVTQQRIEDGDWVRAGRTEVRITFGA
ncbi:MAG: VWA domain-containing protein [Terracidiphilus sp.]